MEENSADKVEQRRSVRRTYYELKNEVVDKKADLLKSGTGGKKLCELIDLTNKNFQNVDKPLEQVRDGEVLGLLAEIGAEKAKGGSTKTSITHAAFFSRLRLLHAPRWNANRTAQQNSASLNWHALGSSTAKFLDSTPSFTCMLGPLSTQVKERKKREKREKQALAKLVNPDEVQDAGDAKQQETDRNMKEMRKVMKHIHRAPMATLINNPASFGQTVENLFTLSFLVRDGLIKLEHGSRGVEAVHVKDLDRERQASEGEGASQTSQLVMSFSMADWREMQSSCSEPLIGHRVYKEDAGAGLPGDARPSTQTVASSSQEPEKSTSRRRPKDNPQSGGHEDLTEEAATVKRRRRS